MLQFDCLPDMACHLKALWGHLSSSKANMGWLPFFSELNFELYKANDESID